MFGTLSLTELQQVTTYAGRFRLGDCAVVIDSTYGPLKAVWVYSNEALTVVGAPVYPDHTAGDWYVTEDENDSGVIGQEYCVGSFLSSAAVTTAFYGWILVWGLTPNALTTDGTADTDTPRMIGTATDGTWAGVAASQNIAASSGTVYTPGFIVGSWLADDSSTTLAAGNALLHSVWASCPQTV